MNLQESLRACLYTHIVTLELDAVRKNNKKQISKDIELQCLEVSADVYEKFRPNLPGASEKMIIL